MVEVHEPGTQPGPPAGHVVGLPGRGESFARVAPGPPGAPTVVLLHGWMSTADSNWFAVYEPLGADYRVVAPDLPGHGRGLRTAGPFSLERSADDLVLLLDRLGIAEVIACGYSMGGAIALQLARRHPGRVRGLVLCATALEWQATWYDRAAWRLLPLLDVAVRAGVDRRLSVRLIDHLAAGDELVAAWRPHLLGELGRFDPRAAVGAGRALAAFDARPFAAALDVPTAVVTTLRDRTVRPGKQAQLAAVMRARRFDLEADHHAFVRRPREWAAAVTSAVESVDAERHRPGPDAQRDRPEAVPSSRFGR
jgi:3-oxoadipate enol-lactonase